MKDYLREAFKYSIIIGIVSHVLSITLCIFGVLSNSEIIVKLFVFVAIVACIAYLVFISIIIYVVIHEHQNRPKH